MKGRGDCDGTGSCGGGKKWGRTGDASGCDSEKGRGDNWVCDEEKGFAFALEEMGVLATTRRARFCDCEGFSVEVKRGSRGSKGEPDLLRL